MNVGKFSFERLERKKGEKSWRIKGLGYQDLRKLEYPRYRFRKKGE